MSVEVLVQRLNQAIKNEIASNHAEMDKGVAHDVYMKLVGRNAALVKFKGTIAEEAKGLGAEDDDD